MLGGPRDSAVERSSRSSDLARIVAFRNVLMHGYAALDDSIV
ncbi:MAG: HepT-like ribonuclease domain-containing protein [Nocardioidaceae bacterium]